MNKNKNTVTFVRFCSFRLFVTRYFLTALFPVKCSVKEKNTSVKVKIETTTSDKPFI